MAKPRAVGADVVVLFCKEAVYGTAPNGGAGGVYTRPALKSTGLGGSQELEADDLINTGNADDTDPSLGALDVSGSIAAPLDARGAGYWLSMVLGVEDAPVEDDGIFTHTWTSGKDLRSYTVQTGYPQLTTPRWNTVLGAKADGFSLPLARNGRAVMTIPMIGQKEVKDVGGARDADPLLFVPRMFDNASGGIKLEGVDLANVLGGSLEFSNGLEAAETIRSDMAIDGSDETKRTMTGSLNVRIGADFSIDDLVDENTPAALTFALKLKAAPTWALTFSMPRTFFSLAKKPVNGPGGVQATVNFRSAYDTDGDAPMVTATLVNDVAAYA